MRILGIDPGLATIGFGIIEKTNQGFTVIDYGVITTPKEMPLIQRLKHIYEAITESIKQFQPHEIAIEELFFSKNITTGIPVSHARGVILLACANSGIPSYEYTPIQIKQALTGYGKAEKSQIQYMTKNILNLTSIPRPDDAADALAIAICHGQTNNKLIDNMIK